MIVILGCWNSWYYYRYSSVLGEETSNERDEHKPSVTWDKGRLLEAPFTVKGQTCCEDVWQTGYQDWNSTGLSHERMTTFPTIQALLFNSPAVCLADWRPFLPQIFTYWSEWKFQLSCHDVLCRKDVTEVAARNRRLVVVAFQHWVEPVWRNHQSPRDTHSPKLPTVRVKVNNLNLVSDGHKINCHFTLSHNWTGSFYSLLTPRITTAAL